MVFSASTRPPVAAGDRPRLILVAVDMGRHLGSEPGRAWAWACALAGRYRLQVVTSAAVAERCRHEEPAAGWEWHVTLAPTPAASGLGYYRAYRGWCREVTTLLQELVPRLRPVALLHITLGSFRVLPRYDRCGVPYVLGPMGGGEVTPRELLRTARLPAGPWLSEWARPWLNRVFTGMPPLRSVMRGSRLAFATSSDTEEILRQMGARATAVIFPDQVPADVVAERAQPPAERVAELQGRIRLVWSGRAVWWKAGQIAVEFLRRLVDAGVEAELSVFSHGHALEAWRRKARTAGVEARCRIEGFVARQELLTVLGRAHAFVYPTLHDSSSPALLEAYAMGLPSLTVGLGGPAVVATDKTGYNLRPRDLDAWIDAAVEQVRCWQREPATWVAASQAARARAAEFGPDHLDRIVGRWLSPGVFAR